VAVPAVERTVWREVRRIGRHCVGQCFARPSTGDRGETVAVEGQQWRRLQDVHARRYCSIFGELQLPRTVYGCREGQKIALAPRDNRLPLPASACSYVLQDWDQALCVAEAFAQAESTVARMRGRNQSVASLEHMNRAMAAPAAP
jgi:hypothetical protein